MVGGKSQGKSTTMMLASGSPGPRGAAEKRRGFRDSLRARKPSAPTSTVAPAPSRAEPKVTLGGILAGRCDRRTGRVCCDWQCALLLI